MIAIKKCVLTFICAALLAVGGIGAHAAGGTMDALAVLGLFYGTENGYEEERELTRGEGTVMLLRVLGQEGEAETAESESPFEDGGWAEKYIGFAYQRGLVKGLSESEFGTDRPMDSGQYAALLLRAMGYRDGTDFDYEAAAQTLGAALGTEAAGGMLKRGEAARLSWLALSARTASGDTLGGRLMAAGAFDRTDYDEAARLAAQKPPPGSTTILFYIIASDLESVQGRASEDIDELLSLPKSDCVNLVLQTGGTEQWKNGYFTGGATQRSVIENGALSVTETLPETEMTDEAALSGFIRWGVEEFPAGRYILVLWDHGFGTMGGFGLDDTAQSRSMTLAQLQRGVQGGGQRFDLIVFDACLMGTLETACALRGQCDYLVASEELTPAAGLYYQDWMRMLCAKPAMDSYALARQITADFHMRSGSYLGGGAGMAVLSPAWAKRTAQEWERLLAASPPGDVRDAAGKCRELGLRDGGFDQFDLGELSGMLDRGGGRLGFYLERLVPFRKNGAALTGFTGLAVYLPHRHNSRYEAVRAVLAGCGFPENYLNTYDIFNQEGRMRQ